MENSCSCFYRCTYTFGGLNESFLSAFPLKIISYISYQMREGGGSKAAFITLVTQAADVELVVVFIEQK